MKTYPYNILSGFLAKLVILFVLGVFCAMLFANLSYEALRQTLILVWPFFGFILALALFCIADFLKIRDYHRLRRAQAAEEI